MTKFKAKKYRADLARPIPFNLVIAEALRSWKVTNGAPDQSAVREWLFDERMRRISLLFEHYGIQQDSADEWFLLAQALANDHVPGFRVAHEQERGVGRPRKVQNNALRSVSPSQGQTRRGPKPIYTSDEIEFFKEHVSETQFELKKDNKPHSKRAAIHWILEIYARIKNKKLSRVRAREIADKHTKTVDNLIKIMSRVKK